MRSWIWGAFYIAMLGLTSSPANAQLTGNAGADTYHPASYVQCYANRLQDATKDNTDTHNLNGTAEAWLFLGASSRWSTEVIQPEASGGSTSRPVSTSKRLKGFSSYCANNFEYSCSGQRKTLTCIQDFGSSLREEKTSCESSVEARLRQCQANRFNQNCETRFNKDYECAVEQSRLEAYNDQKSGSGVFACYDEVNRCSDDSQNIKDLGSDGTGVLTGNAGSGSGDASLGGGGSSGNMGDGSSSGSGSGAGSGSATDLANGIETISSRGNTIVSVTSITGRKSSINTRRLSGNVSLNRNGDIVSTRSTYGDRRAVDRALRNASKQSSQRFAAPGGGSSASGTAVPATPPIKEKASCSPSLKPSRAQILQATDGAQTFSMSTIDGFRGANTLHAAGVVFELADRNTEYISLNDATFPNVRIELENLQSTKLIIACGEYDKVHIGGSSNLRIVDSINDEGESILSIDNEAHCRPYSGLSGSDDYKYAIVQVETHGDPSTFAKSIVLSGVESSHRFVCRQTLNILRTEESFSAYLDEQFPR